MRDAAYLRGGIKYEEVFYVSPRELEEGKRKQEQAKLREEQQRAEQRAAEKGRRQELERVAAEELRRHAAAAEQAQHEQATKTIPIIFPILLLFLLSIPTWLLLVGMKLRSIIISIFGLACIVAVLYPVLSTKK